MYLQELPRALPALSPAPIQPSRESAALLTTAALRVESFCQVVTVGRRHTPPPLVLVPPKEPWPGDAALVIWQFQNMIFFFKTCWRIKTAWNQSFIDTEQFSFESYVESFIGRLVLFCLARYIAFVRLNCGLPLHMQSQVATVEVGMEGLELPAIPTVSQQKLESAT